MGGESGLIIRSALLKDIDFIIETIFQAEKSGTDICALLSLWNCDESQLRIYLRAILEEEIDGTEWSISSFVVAEISNEVVGAFAGWIEGENEWELSSSTLKANLMKANLPMEIILNMSNFQREIASIYLDRTFGSLQLEYAFVLPQFQGMAIIGKIIDFICTKNKGVQMSEVQVFSNNVSAIRAYEKMGFVRTFETALIDGENNIFPNNVKWKLTKYL